MAGMQKHALLTLLGLLLAALAVASIRPNESGGTAFVVVLSVLSTNAIGLAIPPRKTPPRSTVTDTPVARPVKRKGTPK